MSNDAVIAALEAALASDANPNSEVRAHLAELLLADGRHEEAIGHFGTVLGADPANLRCLRGAAGAARALGDNDRADGYERLCAALGGAPDDAAAPPPSTPPPANVTPLADPAPGDDPPARLRAVDTSSDSHANNADNVTVGPWEDHEPRVTLRDVGGMEHVKERLENAFLGPLRNPELMKMYGKSVQGGLMLYGPPGCGKTFIARALAGELGASFFSVGLSDVLDMWLGESERKLHELFETARRAAPAVLFFDEVDAMGQKRSQQRNSGGRNIVNQLLAELDSTDSNNRDVFVLSATNHPWDVDTALRRPGRFDRTVLVLPPDELARVAILEYHLSERPTGNLDIASIAARTSLFSGADLAHLCDTSVERALSDSVKSGRPRPIEQPDLEAALGQIKASTRPWFETARNYAMFANEGGVYDELLQFMKQHKL